MSVQIKWDPQEAQLLLDSYFLIQEYPTQKSRIVRTLSNNLRKRALDLGIEIDDIFRDEGGIRLRLYEMEQIINSNGSKIAKASFLFRETVEHYFSNKKLLENDLKGVEQYRVKITEEMIVSTNEENKVKKTEAKAMPDKEMNENTFLKWAKEKLPDKQFKRLVENKNFINSILLSKKVVKKPIFLIDDTKVIENICNNASSYFANAKIRSDAIFILSKYKEFLSLTETFLEDNENKGKKDASQTDYYNWLSQHELLSGPTCRNYVYGIISSEIFAREHDYEDCIIFGEDIKTAEKTIKHLLVDEEFTKQHSNYCPYLRKYLSYLGIEEEFVEAGLKAQVPSKDYLKADAKLVSDIEEFVKASAKGVSRLEIRNHFDNYSDSSFNSALRVADILCVLQKYYHKDNIEDYEFMADTLLTVIKRQFNAFGDYTSDVQLYKEAGPKLDDFFFYNGAFDSRQEVYDLAASLFGRLCYKGAQFIFREGRHIWKEKPNYTMDFSGLLLKYGRDHGNLFSRDEAVAFFEMHGSGTPSQTLSLILNKTGKNQFLQYAENQFVLAEAINIDENFLSVLKARIEILLEGEDYVALGDVEDYFYSSLPVLPNGVVWGPLLLEAVLELHDIGYITIDAGDTNDLKTIDAALIRKNSAYKTFADVLWNEMNNDFQLPQTLTNEEFRSYLLKKGFIHGMEKITTVHKTVANDLRFYWMDGNSKVTVSK